MEEIPEVTLRMKALGYQRVYDVPNLVIYPTYWEAMEESDREYELADRGEGPLVGSRKHSRDLPPLTLNDIEDMANRGGIKKALVEATNG